MKNEKIQNAQFFGENVIEIKNLNKSYSDFFIQNFNLNIPTGSIVGLIGENGAGKSTILKLIMNAINSNSGEIKVFGVDNKSVEFVKIKNDIGYVLDEPSMPETMNITQIEGVMRDIFDNWDGARFNEFIKKFDLPYEKKFSKFSKGMKMKLSIAIALSHKAKLLILDEATSGLDPVIRDEILDILLDFTRDENHTVLMSSHIVSDLEKACDYIAYIHKGEKILFMEKDEMIERFGIIHATRQTMQEIPAEAIVGTRNLGFSMDVLVDRRKIRGDFEIYKVSIEDIIVSISRGERTAYFKNENKMEVSHESAY